MFRPLALSIALAVAQSAQAVETRRGDINAAYDELQRARGSGDWIDALAAARRLVAAAPDNPVLRAILARSAAKAGDSDLARETLEWLATRGYGLDNRARADLGAMLGEARHATLARRLAVNAASRGSFLSVVQVVGDVHSEGVTYDSRRNHVYLASGEGLFAVRPDGSTQPVVAPEALTDRFVLGVRYDAAHDRVFVCSSSHPGAQNPTAELVILHPVEPARVERFALEPSPRQRLCNDIAVLSDGAAVTDTNTGEVFRYRDGQGVSRLTETRFNFPNGIVQIGDRIIVADLLGLWVLAPNGRLLGRMRTADGDYLGGMDGLAASGDTLIGVQNLTAPGRVVSFRVAGGLLLHDRRVLIAGAPELAGMTTAAVRGDRLLVLSDRADPARNSTKALVELKRPGEQRRPTSKRGS